MKRIEMGVRERMAYDTVNLLIDSINQYNELCEDGINSLNVSELGKHSKCRKDVCASMNAYLQLLTHPMGKTQYSNLYSNEQYSKIRGATLGDFSIEIIEKEIEDGDERNLIEFYFDTINKMIAEGESKASQLDDIIKMISLFEK